MQNNINTGLIVKKRMFNDVYYPYLKEYDKRFSVYYGGAGSGKSVFITQKLLFKYLAMGGRKCLVVRKVDATLRDSCFALFKEIISQWGIYELCKINKTDMTIELPNGSIFLFKGLSDRERIKSIANISDIWIEESTEIEQEDYDQLCLRLRSKLPFNEIIVSFNPVSKSNWCYKRWFEDGANYNKDKTTILHTTYRDNRFLPQEYIDNLLSMKKTNYAYYKIYAEGEFSSLDKKVYNNWQEKQFDYRELLKNENNIAIFGLDWGYVHDPTAIVCSIINHIDKKIWVYDSFSKKGMTNEEIFEQLQNMEIHNARIVCDSAEQKSIEDLRRLGCKRVVACTKGKDSIMNGINLINEYQIYVLPKLADFKEELLNYTWQKDRQTNEYINKPIDKFNHHMDAFRYSVTDSVKNGTEKVKIFDRKMFGF